MGMSPCTWQPALPVLPPLAGDISYLTEQMLVRSFLSSFSSLTESLLGERIKFSFVVSLEENKTKCHLEKFLLLHPQGAERLPQDQD